MLPVCIILVRARNDVIDQRNFEPSEREALESIKRDRQRSTRDNRIRSVLEIALVSKAPPARRLARE